MPGSSGHKDRNNISTQMYEEFKIMHEVKKIRDVFGRVIGDTASILNARNVLNTD
jgi:hypothetical protein